MQIDEKANTVRSLRNTQGKPRLRGENIEGAARFDPEGLGRRLRGSETRPDRLGGTTASRLPSEEGGGPTALEQTTNISRVTPGFYYAPLPTSDTLANVSTPESRVEARAATYAGKVSKVARKYAVALETVGTDGKLFAKIKTKLKKDAAVNKTGNLDVSPGFMGY